MSEITVRHQKKKKNVIRRTLSKTKKAIDYMADRVIEDVEKQTIIYEKVKDKGIRSLSPEEFKAFRTYMARDWWFRTYVM